jgi:hypothetical protein
MSEDAGRNHELAEQERPAATLEIDVDGRWDALSLSELLIPYHSFLVQHDTERWVVHARTPGCHGESLDDALRVLDGWLAEHGLDRSCCRVDGRKEIRRLDRVFGGDG